MTKNLTMILIDDDDAVETAVRYALNQGGHHQLKVAKNGSDGLALLREELSGEEPPHQVAVLLDCHMPIMDGLQFLSELRQDRALRRTPVFMLTSSVDAEDKNQAYDLGISGFVPKPVTIRGFTETIDVIKRFLQIIETP